MDQYEKLEKATMINSIRDNHELIMSHKTCSYCGNIYGLAWENFEAVTKVDKGLKLFGFSQNHLQHGPHSLAEIEALRRGSSKQQRLDSFAYFRSGIRYLLLKIYPDCQKISRRIHG